MTGQHEPDDDEDFTETLASIIEHADGNGIDVEGGWKITAGDGDGSAWDVEITRVVYDQD